MTNIFLTEPEAVQQFMAEGAPGGDLNAWALSKGVIVVPGAPPLPPMPPTRTGDFTGSGMFKPQAPPMGAPMAPMTAPGAMIGMQPPQPYSPPPPSYPNYESVPPMPGPGEVEADYVGQLMRGVGELDAIPPSMRMLLDPVGTYQRQMEASMPFDQVDERSPAEWEAIAGALGITPGQNDGTVYLAPDGTPLTEQQAVELAAQQGGSVPGMGGTTLKGTPTAGGGGAPSWAPPEMPLPVRPDYSQFDQLFTELEPKAPDAEAEQDVRENSLLMGIAKGLLAPAGSVGEMLLNAGAGALGGWASGRDEVAAGKKEYEELLRGYKLSKLEILQGRANQDADFINATNEVIYKNNFNFWQARMEQAKARQGSGVKTEFKNIVGPDGKSRTVVVNTQNGSIVSYRPLDVSVSGLQGGSNMIRGLGGTEQDVAFSAATLALGVDSPEGVLATGLGAITEDELRVHVFPDYSTYDQFIQALNERVQATYGGTDLNGLQIGGTPGTETQIHGIWQNEKDLALLELFASDPLLQDRLFDYLAKKGGYKP